LKRPLEKYPAASRAQNSFDLKCCSAPVHSHYPQFAAAVESKTLFLIRNKKVVARATQPPHVYLGELRGIPGTVRLTGWRRLATKASPFRRLRFALARIARTKNMELKSSVANWGAPADVLARLDGDWTLVRHVDGRPLMSGLATFSANHDGSLAYHERGRLHLADGQALEAERRYLYRASPTGFAVFFFEKPPRLFHNVGLERAPSGLVSKASHRCKDDLYLSRYEFLADGTFFIRHEVSGPRKSYTLETSYGRSKPRTA
jgi:hypothetical protein